MRLHLHSQAWQQQNAMPRVLLCPAEQNQLVSGTDIAKAINQPLYRAAVGNDRWTFARPQACARGSLFNFAGGAHQCGQAPDSNQSRSMGIR